MPPTQITGVDKLAVNIRVGVHSVRVGRRLAKSASKKPAPGKPNGRTSARSLMSRVSALREVARSHIALQRVLADKKYVRFGEHVYFDAFSPRFPGPVFDEVIASTVRSFDGRSGARRRFIPYVVLAITDRCMYRCEHCYAKEALGKVDTLSLDQWKQIIDRFQDIGTGVFGLEGGEPLLRFDDLIALCEHARAKSELWIATTGWGLTPTKARRLAEAGLAGAAVSLDHYEPDKHNAFRGNKKAFDEAAKAIALCSQAGIFPALAVCATRDVIADNGLERYLELARDLGAGVVQVLDPVPTGNFLGKDVSLTEAELRELQRFQHLVNTSPRYRDYPAISTRTSLEDDHSFGCGAGGNAIIYVDPKGNLQPCPFMGMSTGNLVTDGFDTPMQRMRQLFPRPAAVGISCPVSSMCDEIAEARANCDKLPLPYETTRALCEQFANAPLPAVYAGMSRR